MGKWLALALVAHALIIGWMILWKPVALPMTGAPGEPRDIAGSASAERVQEVAAEIQATQAEEIKSKVQELLNTQEMLAGLDQQKQEEFDALARQLATEAPQKTVDAVAMATAAQATAQQAEVEAVQAMREMMEAKAEADKAATPEEKASAETKFEAARWQAKEAQGKAKNAQSAATEAQTNAAQQLGFLDDSYAAAKSAQGEASAAQTEANQKQDTAAEATSEVAISRKQAERASEAAATAQKQAEGAASRIQSLESALQKSESSLSQQQQTLAGYQKAIADAKAGGEAAAETKAAQGAQRTQTAIESTQSKMEKARAELEKAKEKLTVATGKAASTKAEAEQTAAAAEAAPVKAQVAQTEALEAQTKAGEIQTRAQSAVTKAAAQSTAGSATPPAGSLATAEMAQATVNLDGKSFGELYEMAVEAEKGIAEKYKGIRAAEAATIRQIPIQEAAKSIQLANPQRPGLDPALASQNIEGAQDLREHNEAMEKALAQMESMVSLARGMAYEAQNRSGGQTAKVSVADLKTQALENRQLTAAATESAAGAAADLTEMMKNMQGGPFSGEGGPPSVEMGNAESGSAGSGAPGAGTSGAAAADGKGGSGKPGQASSGPGSGQGAGGRGVGAGYGFRTPGDYGLPSVGEPLDSIPGRKVHGQGQGSGSKWMFIDTWYVIGPFPNPQRRNIDTKFPPETVIDLDAAYLGKDDQPVRWEFYQASRAQMRPPHEEPYAIYYAYTNLWFDEERDMWIAVGSDDYSKLWINNMLVWASGSVQKNWKPNEGYRKVHFKKGLNRVLYRIENGQNACIYSLMLNMSAGPS